MNLRGIEGAKEQFAIDHHSTNGAVVTKENLKTYFRYGEWPECPGGGYYIIGLIGDAPKCTDPAHLNMKY
jgi:hypothetical protein